MDGAAMDEQGLAVLAWTLERGLTPLPAPEGSYSFERTAPHRLQKHVVDGVGRSLQNMLGNLLLSK